MTRSIGTIGCGEIAQVRYTPEYTNHRDARLYALYDLSLEWVRELAGTYTSRIYETYEELLGDGKINAVSVCVLNGSHVKVFVAAPKAGKDVLCEKLTAVTPKECHQMTETAKETGKCLMIGQNQRLVKGHVFARKLTEYGDIGKVITPKATSGHGGSETWSIDPDSDTWFSDKEEIAMGVMANLGIHKTDLIQYLMGEYVAETIAVITTLDKKDRNGNLIGVDDNTTRIYKMESGTVGVMIISQIYYDQEDSSTILHGSKEIMRTYEDPEYCIKTIKPDNEAILYNVDQAQTSDRQTKSDVIDAFMDCIVHGKETQLSGKSILSAMEVVFANIEPAKTGETIKIG